MQLTLFDFEKVELEEIQDEESVQQKWWWDYNDFKLAPGGLMMLSSMMEYESGHKGADFFRYGYMIEVYEDAKKVLCFFPKPYNFTGIKEKLGLVNYSDLAPIAYYEFDEKEYRFNHPLPNLFTWRNRKIKLNEQKER